MIKHFISICYLLYSLNAIAQVGIGTTNPDPSAILEVKSSSKGFLMPRMTTSQRNLITTPVEGLVIFNTDRNALQFYRENVGTNNDLSGWFDTNCENDIGIAISNFPSGIILDFSDFDNNGQFFSNINGTGSTLTSSSPDLTPFLFLALTTLTTDYI